MPQYITNIDDDILHLYCTGRQSLHDIGKWFGISHQTVKTHLKHMGVPIRNRIESIQLKAIPLEIGTIKKLYCEDKISPPKIAEMYGVSSGTIRKRLNQIGIKTKQFKGIHCSPDTEFKKGNHYSPETEWRKGEQTAGENHHSWKGGITPINDTIRHSAEYKEWAESVYKRDYYTCQRCGVHCKRGNIIAHHIKTFNEYPELRFDIDNGMTLCRACHIREHNAN